MNDYIKREDFENQLMEIEKITMMSHIDLGEEPETGEISMPISTVRNILKKCPSAEVVEVVRCKECKNWNRERAKRNHIQFDGYCETLNGYSPREYYCAWGESTTEKSSTDCGWDEPKE